MKQLVCEMCGSTDLLKDGGVFVCQSCGCRYTVEEAKKMMVEGVVEVQGTVSIDNTVDVQGTVQVDNTANVERYLANARRAKEKQDWEEAEKYYNMVEQNDPENIEAIFYSAFAKAKNAIIQPDCILRGQALIVLQNSISVLDDNFRIEDDAEVKSILGQITEDLTNLILAPFVISINSREEGSKTTTYQYKSNLRAAYFETLDNIAAKYPASRKKERVFYYSLIMQMGNALTAWNKYWLDYHDKGYGLKNPEDKYREDVLNQYAQLIEYCDPNSGATEIEKTKGESYAGCYVATAVYGSYDCPQVWTLRRYRDYSLAETWRGRAFIKAYYAISPAIVRLFGNTGWFKALLRGRLDRMVRDLQAEGFESTPYNDRVW